MRAERPPVGNAHEAAMNASHGIDFGTERIDFRLRRSKRKTLAITVRPDTSVLVTAPEGANLETVKAKLRKRAIWVRRQRRFFERFLPKVPPRRYVGGETHRYLGRQYRLVIVESGEEIVKLNGRFIHVHTLRKADTGRIRFLLQGWYSVRAQAAFERSLRNCLPSLRGRINGVPRLRLRRMPKRWGSWTKRGDIYLNPELVMSPPSCIDYVVTHELCHLVHASHGPEFYRLLRKAMPDWEVRKARLEQDAAQTGVGGVNCILPTAKR